MCLRLLVPIVAAAVLPGCGVYFVGDSGEGGEGREAIPVITNPPTYPSDAVIFTVDAGTEFNGEQLDLRIDGVRVYRKNLTTEPGNPLTERVRLALAPGPHTFYVRIGSTTFNVNTERPVDVSAQPCAAVSFGFNPDNPQASRVTIDLPDPATCPR